MNKTDLRVRKSIRAIKQAFSKLIRTKPVNKISVAELAKEAEINKGTFYLHYSDIYQLYDEMVVEIALEVASKFAPYPELFTAPEKFVHALLFSDTETPDKTTQAILKEENLKFSSSHPQCFIDAIRSTIYEVGKLVPCRENDIKIEFMLIGMISILTKPGLIDKNDAECIDYVVRYLSEIMRQSFPEFYMSVD